MAPDPTVPLPTPERPWLIAVEGVTRTRTQIRGRYRDHTSRRHPTRRQDEAIEWQAGQTLALYYTTLGLTNGLPRRIIPPGGYDELHTTHRGGTGNLEEHYPRLLTGKEPRPDHWQPNDTKLATGQTRGQHERAAWAIAMRAACEITGTPWNPRALLGLRGLPPVIGIDPGAEWTGIVACVGGRVLDAATIGRAASPPEVTGFDVDAWVIDRFLTALARLMTVHHDAAVKALEASSLTAVEASQTHETPLVGEG